MSRRGGRPYKRLPSKPEGDKKRELLEKEFGRTLVDRKFLVAALEQYHREQVKPLWEIVRFLRMPFYKRWWYRLRALLDGLHTLQQKFARWRYVRRWARLEKKGDHAGEPQDGD